MDNKEAEEVLEELYQVRPEKLNDKTKRLFEAIMIIANERDYYKNKYEELKEFSKSIRDCNKEFEL